MTKDTLARALAHAKAELGSAEEKRSRAERSVDRAKAHVADLEAVMREHDARLRPFDIVNAAVANGLCQQNGLLAAAQSGGFAKNAAS